MATHRRVAGYSTLVAYIRARLSVDGADAYGRNRFLVFDYVGTSGGPILRVASERIETAARAMGASDARVLIDLAAFTD